MSHHTKKHLPVHARTEERRPRVLADGRAGRVVECAGGHVQLQIGAMSLHLTDAALLELLSTLRKAARTLEEERFASVLRRPLADVQ
jgi:hypothetical protein